MKTKPVAAIEAAIAYIEAHLDSKLDLQTLAKATHYSKYHLHRIFVGAVGLSIHDYVLRRQMTEAAKLLVFSDKPIIDIAMICGYESQQAFSSAFKAMYKLPPAMYRENGTFYPLQLRFALHQAAAGKAFSKSDIALAEMHDIPAWMNLMRLAIDGYPVMDEDDYLNAITAAIREERALVLKDDSFLVGAMVFSACTGSIDFLGVHPQYRHSGIQKLFLDALMETYLPGREISMTTYREGDRADTGHRQMLEQLGFAERELLIEFGYPTQRFVLAPKEEENAR